VFLAKCIINAKVYGRPNHNSRLLSGFRVTVGSVNWSWEADGESLRN
jgi:hypothetical protein